MFGDRTSSEPARANPERDDRRRSTSVGLLALVFGLVLGGIGFALVRARREPEATLEPPF